MVAIGDRSRRRVGPRGSRPAAPRFQYPKHCKARLLFCFLALSTWGLGLGIMGLVFYLNSLTHPLITKVVIAQKVAGTLVEFSIALGMCYLFGSHRKRTVSTSTANILHRLIVFSLSRGVLMGLTQLAYTATFFAYQEKMYWVVLHCLASKCL
ncbi:hypothetical protein OF83DRAFT_396450 [Amylostereum chailletii]|nr:hypothetical protein OF83DRAFT_396450 [Amylostereum chailletii]